MAIQKCPRCELNYILDDAPYCMVCRREVKGEKETAAPFDPCSICNENPALPGKDLCLFCLKELEGEEAQDKEVEPVKGGLSLGGASEMEEIAIDDTENDIPGTELGEIDRALSLEEMQAKEEMDMDEEQEEDR